MILKDCEQIWKVTASQMACSYNDKHLHSTAFLHSCVAMS